MAYLNNIPQPTDKLKDSQVQILGNFAAIQTLIDVDHATFGSAQQGKHNKVTLPVQATVPPFAADQNGLYTQLSAAPLPNPTNKNEIYVHGQKVGGATTNIPMTASILSTANPGQGADGWTYLPSGIIMAWSYTPAAFAAATLITLPAALQKFTTIFAVIATPYQGPIVPVSLVAINSNTTFTLAASAATWARYLVIGV